MKTIFSGLWVWLIPFFLLHMVSCSTYITKSNAFPHMYEEKPLSIVVLPPINESTDAEAKGYYITTIAEPLSQSGFYVFPTEVVTDILYSEGLYDIAQLTKTSIPKFKEYFGADAILLLYIKEWDTSYFILGGNVTVNLAYKLVSTTSQDTLWQYTGEITVDTSGGTGGQVGLAGLIVAVVSTAIETATTKYVPIAKDINVKSLETIPYGRYHKGFNKDGAEKVVKVDLVK